LHKDRFPKFSHLTATILVACFLASHIPKKFDSQFFTSAHVGKKEAQGSEKVKIYNNNKLLFLLNN